MVEKVEEVEAAASDMAAAIAAVAKSFAAASTSQPSQLLYLLNHSTSNAVYRI